MTNYEQEPSFTLNCIECGKKIDPTELNWIEMALYSESGLCPHCYDAFP
jgi:hypothetical protein